MNSFSDIEYLLQELVCSNEDAWSYFIKRYGGLIYHCINKIGDAHTSKEDKEDCFQEILKVLIEDNYRRLKQIRSLDEKAFRSWLGSVTYCRTLNYLRGKKKAFFVPDKNIIMDILSVLIGDAAYNSNKPIERAIDNRALLGVINYLLIFIIQNGSLFYKPDKDFIPEKECRLLSINLMKGMKGFIFVKTALTYD